MREIKKFGNMHLKVGSIIIHLQTQNEYQVKYVDETGLIATLIKSILPVKFHTIILSHYELIFYRRKV